MPFDVIQATEILRGKYKARVVTPNSIQNVLEAEDIPLDVGQEHLQVDIFANATSLRATRVDLFVFDTPTTFHTENRTTMYLTHAQVIRFLEQIKADLGIP